MGEIVYDTERFVSIKTFVSHMNVWYLDGYLYFKNTFFILETCMPEIYIYFLIWLVLKLLRSLSRTPHAA